ncbi:MAG: hypothetical protein DSY80_10135 [Desulfocapsa sp.]|nr:MAG: hypothetical protein DSY80_10135 [Desulfocapsa sp.]
MSENSGIVVKMVDDKAQTREENQILVGKTMERHRKAIFPPFPNLAQRKQVHGHLRKELEKGFEFRLKKLSLQLDTALHQVREESNHALVTGKTHLRKERMEFFAESYHEIVEKLNDLSDRFLTGLDGRFKRLEDFKTQVIRDREEQRLTKSVDDFLSTLDQLVDDYRNIISEHVDLEKW